MKRNTPQRLQTVNLLSYRKHTRTRDLGRERLGNVALSHKFLSVLQHLDCRGIHPASYQLLAVIYSAQIQRIYSLTSRVEKLKMRVYQYIYLEEMWTC